MDKTGVNLLYIKKDNNKNNIQQQIYITFPPAKSLGEELIEAGVAKDIFTNTRFIYRWTKQK